MTEIFARTFQRTASAAAWASVNPILGKGEIGIDETNNQARVGDGATPWLKLPPVGATADQIAALITTYLTANPPAGGGGTDITIVDHPTIRGAGILTIGSSSTPAPTVTTQPKNTAVHQNNSATISAAASDPNATAQWEISADRGATWSTVAGATGWAITPSTAATVGDSTGLVQYRVTFTSGGRSVTSTAAWFSVWENWAWTEQPASTQISSTQSVTFRAAGTGQGWSRTWEQSTDGGTTWTVITGATGFLTFTADSGLNGYRYRCVAVHSVTGRRVASSVATLTYAAGAAPQITSPTATEVLYTERWSPLALESSGSGTPNPTIQWQRLRPGGSWGDISGATSANVNLDLATEFPGGFGYSYVMQYRVIYANSGGSTTSAVLTVYNDYQP